jgi:hypothetical protein
LSSARHGFLPRRFPLIIVNQYRVTNEFSANTLHATLPNPHQFGDYVPGLKLFEDLCSRFNDMLALSLEIFVLSYVIHVKDNHDALMLAHLVVFLFVVLSMMPTNGFGGAGM